MPAGTLPGRTYETVRMTLASEPIEPSSMSTARSGITAVDRWVGGDCGELSAVEACGEAADRVGVNGIDADMVAAGDSANRVSTREASTRVLAPGRGRLRRGIGRWRAAPVARHEAEGAWTAAAVESLGCRGRSRPRDQTGRGRARSARPGERPARRGHQRQEQQRQEEEGCAVATGERPRGCSGADSPSYQFLPIADYRTDRPTLRNDDVGTGEGRTMD